MVEKGERGNDDDDECTQQRETLDHINIWQVRGTSTNLYCINRSLWMDEKS